MEGVSSYPIYKSYVLYKIDRESELEMVEACHNIEIIRYRISEYKI